MRRIAALLRVLPLVVAGSLAAGLLVAPTPARAQGDWEVQRDPFDRQVIARYKRILAKNPADRDALRKVARLYKRYRTIELLISEYEKQVEKDADDFAALVVLGHLYLDHTQADKALASYQRAAALRPKDPAVQLALGELHRGAGATGEATAAYQAALDAARSRGQKSEALRALADLALTAGDIDAAKTYFEQYIALDPRNNQARLELADALLGAGRADDAIAVLGDAEKRMRADPARRVEVIARIGKAHEEAGRDNQAIAEYRRAMSLVKRGYYLRKELTERVIEIHRRRQDLGTLLSHYEKTWPAGRRDHFEWDVLARLHEELGDQEKAIAAYRNATRKAPYELDTQRRLIALLENSGRESEALQQYEAVIRVAPGEPRFQLELAQRYWDRGDEKRALALLARMERRFPSDGGVHAAIADLYNRWDKAELALRTYERLTGIEPEDTNHLVNLGEQYFQRNQRAKAVAVWKRIASRKTAKNFARLGEVYAEHDMPADALAMYSKAIKLEPKNPDHYKGRATAYARQRNYADAVTDWETVLSLTPDKAADQPMRREARRRIVSLLKRSGALNRRVSQWERAFRKSASDLEAGYFLVEAYSAQNQLSKARVVLEKVLAQKPDDLEAMQQLVKIYKRTMDYDKAVALLLELIERSPGREREYYNQIAEIKTDDRKDEEAIFYAQKALEKSPADPVAHQRLAERYVAMQQFDRAIASYEKTVELDPRNYGAYFALAKLYTHKSAPRKAATLYREVLRRATDSEILRKAGAEAIDLEEMTGSLGELEQVVAQLSFTFPHKDIYRRTLVELYARYVPRLVARTERGGRAEQAAARKELQRLGAHGLKPLLEALNDEKDVTQQRIAVGVLGYLDNQGAAAPLVRLARESGDQREARRRIGTLTPTLDWDVRVEALVAAGRLGDPRTIPDLVELAEHREIAMREAAIFALGRTGDRRALPALQRALDDANPSAQTLACISLGQIAAATGDTRPLERVGRSLADPRRHDLARAACAFAIGYVGDRAAVPLLIEILAEGNGETQRLAAWALGRIGDARAVPALLSAYLSRQERVREGVSWALARIAERGAPPRPPVDAYPMRNGKYHAREAVWQLGGDLGRSRPPAQLILGHESDVAAGIREALARHRDLVVQVLGDLDSQSGHLALGPLTAGLEELSGRERKRVETALSAIGVAIAKDIEALSSHRDAKVRSLVMSVMAKIDAPATTEVLRRGIADDDPAVARDALEAAAAHVALHPAAAGPMAAAVGAQLGSDDWQIRALAARVLGSFGSAADDGALTAALADGNGYVREAAAHALAELARPGALPGLLAASRDDLAHVRKAAAMGLAGFSDDSARARLTELAGQDPSESVRKAARAALARRKK